MLPLNTNRLFIHPCRLPLLTEIFLGHPHARETLQANIPENWPQPDLKEQLPHFIELLQHDPRSFPWMLWIIVNKEEGTVIGDIGFKGRPDKNGVVEIGYTLLPSWRKKGYMREAATALVEWAFRQPHVKKLIAECDVTNTASMKVLQHLGMEEVKSPGEMLHWQLLNK
ncbi:GNAT family N-acetyltransferase [Chitinophaga sp. RCC_12]|uniref:GNAT family N-acetyltransferase n=1 Tax=unclassified Chitinophaga TaxID=2619133 RepID=UPI0035250E26